MAAANGYGDAGDAACDVADLMCGSLCSINIDNAAIKFTKRHAVAAEAEAHAAS